MRTDLPRALDYTIDILHQQRIYPVYFVLVETAEFSRQRVRLLSDEAYRAFQIRLIADPDLGTALRGTGGIRKVRVPAKGHGKRGGGSRSAKIARARH